MAIIIISVAAALVLELFKKYTGKISSRFSVQKNFILALFQELNETIQQSRALDCGGKGEN